MTLKNKDFIKLFQRLDKYFKINESVFIEGIELTQRTPTYVKHINIYNSDHIKNSNTCDFCLSYREGEKPKCVCFYINKENEFVCYYLNNLEEEITNFHILKAFNILSNLKILKLIDF